MKKNYLFFSLFLISMVSFSQKTIIVNGGKWGDQSENVNVMVYDIQSKSTTVIDTIHSQSVQDILIDDSLAYVVAEDSLVLYDLNKEERIAATAFQGVSTKTLAISANELLVGNWYGQDSSNLYFYNKTNLDYIDSLHGVSKGAKSILINNGYAYIPQNTNDASTGFQDSLGSIIRIDISKREITDTINVASYTEDMGELILNPDGMGFYSINSVSNTITSIDFATLTATNKTFNQNFRVGSKSQYSIYKDTAYLRMNEGIGAINLNNLTVIDSVIVDTVVTAFTYDTINHHFYVTQTDFFSYASGRIYDRSGSRMDTLKVGFSPEVIRMYYGGSITSLEEGLIAAKADFKVFPNPTIDFINIEISELDQFDQLTLFNQSGQLVMTQTMINIKEILQLEGLDKGVYFLNLRGKNNLSSTKKIILH